MGDGYHGFALHQFVQTFLNHAFYFRIQRAGRWSLTGGATVSRGGVGARIAVTGILYDER